MLSRLFSRTVAPAPKHRGRVRSRVPLPAVVDPPADLLRELRAWDARLDLYIRPDGTTYVLLKNDKGARIDEGRKLLAEHREDGLAAWWMVLMAEGFEMIHEDRGPMAQSAGHLLYWIRRKMAATDAEIDAELATRKARSDGTTYVEEAVRTVRDRIRSDARSDWRWAHRGKKSFSQKM